MIHRYVFSGKAYSGKTTCADYFVTKYNMQKLSFATILKELCRDVFNMKKKNRSLLQDVGTALRSVDEDVFVNYLERKIEMLGYRNGIVVDDLRYQNELKMLKRQKFMVMRLIVDDEILKERAGQKGKIMTSAQLNHPSEKDLDNIYQDICFMTNEGTLKELYNKLDKIYKMDRTDKDGAYM